MSEIKYEQVFGPQELLNSASDDAVLAIKDTTSGRIHFFTNKGWIKSGLKHERYIGTSDNEIAMRRIIKTPVWTVADQQAGKLPEVGAKVIRVDHEDEGCNVIGEVIATWRCAENNESSQTCLRLKDGTLFLVEFFRNHKPIETPSEKAQRLEDEWVNKAWSETAVFAGVTQDEHDRLRIHLRHIYRAQLSGELAAPKGCDHD